ncbi:MAG: acyl-CoA thioesterase [Immundisolibacteraceae bacterium]|nr:acyl-CoA thioesterase [Immundisolibacteraceae bacterium]
MEFEVKRQIYWGECDPAGIVYTPKFLDMSFQAMEHFWQEHVQIGWLDLQAEQQITTPMVHVEMDFMAPARSGDHISIWFAIEKLGRSTIHYRARGMMGQRPLFVVRIISSMVDQKIFKSVEIPTAIRAKLAPFVLSPSSE